MFVHQPIDESIRKKAYYLWELAGRPEGQNEQFWFQAEKELKEQEVNKLIFQFSEEKTHHGRIYGREAV